MINQTIDIKSLETNLTEIELDSLKEGADYSALKLLLDGLFTPSIISDDRTETPMHSTPSADYIATLENTNVTDETINEKMKKWNDANVEITAFQDIKKAAENTDSRAIATEYMLQIKSKADLHGIYLVIVPPEADIIFKEDYKDYEMQKIDNAIIFTMDLSNDSKEIDFAIAGDNPAGSVAIFASPSLSELEMGNVIECGDGICQSSENYNTCAEDCPRPYGKAVVWIIIVLVAAGGGIFAIWKYYAVSYDKQMMEKLFKPKEDFQKITFFITNAMNKGLEDNEIKQELEKAGWKHSQIDYAMQKVKSQRNSMQKQTVSAFISRELGKKSEDDIKKELRDAGWSSSLISYGFKKAREVKRH